MKKSKKLRALFFAVLLSVVLIALWQMVTWGRASYSQKVLTDEAKDQYPVADPNKPEPVNAEDRTKRHAKAQKYNQKQKSVSPMIVQTAEGNHWPTDFPALPASLSDAVVIGEISGAEAFLSEDGNSVYSEFTVRIDDVLKNNTALPLAPHTTLITERKGGRVRYPSGHVSWLFVVGQGMPRVGGKYVLFLKKVDQDFDLLTAYELRGGKVMPLDYSPGVVHFDRYNGSEITVFLNDVRDAISRCSTTSIP